MTKTNSDKLQAAKTAFANLCAEYGTDAITEENAILNDCPRDCLPECAVAVLDGKPATVEYWEFLADQTAKAQAEHDAEVARGHEWHE